MRRLLTLAALTLAATAALAGPGGDRAQARPLTCGSGSNGSQGYAYAGHQATTVAHGIRATITPTTAASVAAGHVAGWIGVGGPGQGAHGENVWLQVGVTSLPGTPTMLYAEITRNGQEPQFLLLLEDVQVGESHEVAVLELSGRPSWWRVWLDGKAVTGPIRLDGSTRRWRPIATAESWNGRQAVCNRFSFRFDGVGVASRRGGSWLPFEPGHTFEDRGFGVRPLSPVPGAKRTLAGGGAAPYAFRALSL